MYLSIRDLPTLFFPLKWSFCVLFIVNLMIWGLKSVVVTQNAQSRSYFEIENFVKKNIRPGSKVIGDDMYSYAVQNDSCDFKYMHFDSPDINKIEKHRREIFNYDYLLFSDNLKNIQPSLLTVYKQHSNLQLISKYTSKSSSLLNVLSRLHIYGFSKDGYNGSLYKRVKNNI